VHIRDRYQGGFRLQRAVRLQRRFREEHPLLALQRSAGNQAVAQLVNDERESPVLDVVGKGGGQPLPGDLRTDMEGRLGADFSSVRIHTDGPAAASATAVQARAYTVGEEVVFGPGAFDANSSDGRHTLAHELTHVVQQRSGPVDGTPTGDGISVSDPSDRFEQQAEQVATGALREPTRAATVAAPAPAGVQREELSLQAEDMGDEDQLSLQAEDMGDEDKAEDDELDAG
jgi:hypothetical protein